MGIKEDDIPRANSELRAIEQVKLLIEKVSQEPSEIVTLHISERASYTQVNPIDFNKAALISFLEAQIDSKKTELTKIGVDLKTEAQVEPIIEDPNVIK